MRITFDTGIIGLTPGYAVLNAAGTVFHARTTVGVTDLGGGTYSVEVADATLGGRTVLWDTGETVPRYASETFATDFAAIKAKTDTIPASPAAVGSAMTLTSPYDAAKAAAAPGAAMTLTSGERTSVASAVSGLATTGLAALKALLDAVKLKSDTLGSLAVTVTSPVAESGTITVEQGDSYSAGRGRPIDVDVDDPTHAKGLDAENTTLYLLATQFTWEASSVTETVPGYLVRFEPTIAQTAAVLRGQSYKLKACIDQTEPTDDDAETIQRGRVVLNRDIPAVT